MAKVTAPLLALNAGEVSKAALARVDVEKLRLAAEVQVNWLPSVIGAMTLRPGLQYIGATDSNNAALPVPFIFGTSDTAMIELTANLLRVWKNDALITRQSVSTTITEGHFSSATGWTLVASSGASATIGSSDIFPSIVGRTSSSDTTAATSHTVALPSELSINDLAIVSFAIAAVSPSGAGTATFPAGWTALYTDTTSSASRLVVYYRVIDGTEGSSITVTTSLSRRTSYVVQGFAASNGVPTIASTTAGGADTSPNPPNINPATTQSRMWIAVAMADNGPTFTAVPTNYTSAAETRTGSGSGHCGISVAERSLSASSENPGVFTIGSSQVWDAVTIAVHPEARSLLLSAYALGSAAYCQQQVTVATADIGVAHSVAVSVLEGPVDFMIGSQSGNDDYFSRSTLETGQHSIGFTPIGDFYVKFASATPRTSVVDSVLIESSGVMSLTTPWAADDLDYIRYAQSGDIIYVACDGLPQYQIERRDNDSWSVVKYRSDKGPYSGRPLWMDDVSPITAGAQYGATTLTSASGVFDESMKGRLMKLPNGGQNMVRAVGYGAQWTDPIRVRGIGTDDDYSYTLSGTWVGTVTRQVSTDADYYGFMSQATHTGNGTTAVTTATTYDNVTFWVRWGFAAIADYTSGNVIVTADYDGIDASFGTCRITSVNSPTVASVEIIEPLKDTKVLDSWSFGKWYTGTYPSAVALHEGRLWWAGGDDIDGSVSDDYTNFDDSTEGDAGPISRTCGSGPVDVVNWLLPLQRLIVGTEGAEISLRSSSQDEPLTPTNSMPKTSTTQGSSALPAVKVDQRGIFVDKSGRRVYELEYALDSGDYRANDLTRLNTDIGLQGFVAIAPQRQPDTYIHMPRGDGMSAILLREPQDQVSCWTRMMTLGVIERVAVLPSSIEDSVYFVVKRTINGSTVRYIEKMARKDQCVGGSLNYQADSFLSVSQASSTTISGLSHLEAATVVVWANGKNLGSYTVSSGAITVSEAVTTAIVGLGGVTASYDSATPAASVTVGTAYNGYPCVLFANRSTGGKLRYAGTVTVASGVATLPNGKTATRIIAYLGYYAPFVSAKLAYGAQMGTALNQRKKINAIGLVAQDMHPQGVKVGQTFEEMDDLPLIEDGTDVDQDEVWGDYDSDITSVPGEWDTDARLCLLAQAPKPATISAVVLAVQTNE